MITPGSILIDKSNFKLIKKLSGILNISNDGYIVKIKANRNLKFNSIDPEQFPEVPKDIDKEAFNMPENIFKDKLKIKAFAAKNHFRAVFTGVLISKDNMVTSNTHYLAKYKLNIENKCEEQIILPIQSVDELGKILDKKNTQELQFYYSTEEDEENNLKCLKYLKIVGKDFIFITRLIEGVFPNYEAVIPQSFCANINIEKRKLQDTLEFVMEIVKDEKTKPIVFEITNQLKICTPEGMDKSMNEILPSEITGEETNMCFNSEYMGHILKIISEDKINIKMSGVCSPAVFIGEDNEDELYVLVPVSLKEPEQEEDVAV